jgi:hypothetical protein
MDYYKGSLVFPSWRFRGGFDSFGKSGLANCDNAGCGDLELLPSLLFRVLCHRKVCGPGIQIFRADVFFEILVWAAEVGKARCAVTARAERAEQCAIQRLTMHVAPQRAVPANI